MSKFAHDWGTGPKIVVNVRLDLLRSG